MSGGFFRGTSADQDTRFSNKNAKLLKSQKFAPELDVLVEMAKVKMDVVRPWIATRVTELLGFEDEVLINFIYGLLDVKEADGKHLQIQLTGFMEKNTGRFMKELWSLLTSAQNNISGIPQQFLDAKAEEAKKKKDEKERILSEVQKKKDEQEKEAEQERQRKLNAKESKFTSSATGGKHGASASPPRKEIDGKPNEGAGGVGARNGVSPPARRRRSRSISRSPRRRRRSGSPYRRGHSPVHRRSPALMRSPVRMRSPVHRRSPVHMRSPPRRRRSPLYSRSPPRRRKSPPRSPRMRSRSPSHIRRRSPAALRSPHRSSPHSRRKSPVEVHSPPPHRRRSSIEAHSPPRTRRRSSVDIHSPTRVRTRSSVEIHTAPHVRRGSSADVHSPLLVQRQASVELHSPPHIRKKSPVEVFSPPTRRRSPVEARSPPLPRRRPVDVPSPPHIRRRSPVEVHSPSHFQRRSPLVVHSSPRREIRLSPRRHLMPLSSPSKRRSPSLSPSLPVTRRSPSRSPRGRSMSREHARYSRSPYQQKRSPSRDRAGPLIRSPYNRRGPDSRRSKSPFKRRRSPSREPPSRRTALDARDRDQQIRDSTRFERRFDRSDKREVHEQRPSQRRDQERLLTREAHDSRPPEEHIIGEKRSQRELAEHIESGPVRKEKSFREDVMEDTRAVDKSLVGSQVLVTSHQLVTDDVKMTLDGRDLPVGPPTESDDEADLRIQKVLKGSKVVRASVDLEDGSISPTGSDDKLESKKRRKEEKRLRKEEKRRRREEKQRRREEKRNVKSSKVNADDEGSAGRSRVGKSDDNQIGPNEVFGPREVQGIKDEDTENEQKRLERELRNKALESLRAKKGIVC